MDASKSAIEQGKVTRVQGTKIRVQVPSILGKLESAWASPVGNGFPAPVVGSLVWITFEHGDVAKPLYFPNSKPDQIIPDTARGIISASSFFSVATATLCTVAFGNNAFVSGSAINFTLTESRWYELEGSVYITSGSANNAQLSIKTYPGNGIITQASGTINPGTRGYVRYLIKGPRVATSWALSITNPNSAPPSIVAASDSVTPVWFTLKDVGPV